MVNLAYESMGQASNVRNGFFCHGVQFQSSFLNLCVMFELYQLLSVVKQIVMVHGPLVSLSVGILGICTYTVYLLYVTPSSYSDGGCGGGPNWSRKTKQNKPHRKKAAPNAHFKASSCITIANYVTLIMQNITKKNSETGAIARCKEQWDLVIYVRRPQ